MDIGSLKVLLVEDNPGDARLIREMLRGASCDRFVLEHVERLADGLERLSADAFAVVLLDLTLEETQGMETFHTLRVRAPGVPVVVLTGANDDALAAEALQAGAQDYLVKGQVDRNVLARALRYAVERGRIEEQLRQRAAELAESGKRKDEFLAILSHELRNPLSPLKVVTELLRKPELPLDEREWAANVVDRQVGTMTRLIDDLLDISRISLGRIELRKTRMDLTPAIRRAIEATRPLLQENHHQLIVSLPADPIWMEADAVRLEQVIANLLTNAAKYTRAGGRVFVSATEEDGQAIVRVQDTGIGIPPEMLDRIFELFTQVDRSTGRSSQWGMGVGLALVRDLVELHGGVVKASSPGPGRGSEFVLRLPVSHGVGPAEQLLPRERPTIAPAAVADQPRRILLVEDHLDSAMCLARVLESWEHAVHVVHSGPAALAVTAQFRPDVILLDIGLPGMDGYEVAQQLRQRPECRDALILAITGYGRQEDRERAAVAGFDSHLTKPIDLVILRALLSAHREPHPAET